MSSPENQLESINPPDNTSPEPNTQPSSDLDLTDEETNLGLTEPPPPAINPPDNT